LKDKIKSVGKNGRFRGLVWHLHEATLSAQATLGNLLLTAVHIQPTGNLAMPVQSFSKWLWIPGSTLVAIIPNDDASRQAAQQAFKDYKSPVGAVVYVGPYRIRGSLLSDRPDRPSPSRASLLPLQGAEIDSQLPGGKPTGLQASWLLLNGGLSHGLGMP
jgi:hypothetical protein